MDLTPLAGMTIADDPLVETYGTSTGNSNWAVYYTNYVLLSADGTVHPIFTGVGDGESLTMSTWNQAGASGVAWSSYVGNCPVSCLALEQMYYHGDQIGSSRLLTASTGGWPVWQGTFLPYGEEYSPQVGTSHYKFTGKERDNESGLDYFGARYYGNTVGRFLTPDWAAKATASTHISHKQHTLAETYPRNSCRRLA